MILLILSTFSIQEDDFFVEIGKKINKDYILLTCNVTFTNREFVHRIEWYKETEIWAVNNLQHLYSESRKRIQISSFINITRDIDIIGDVGRDVDYNNIGTYICQVYTTLEESPAKFIWEKFNKKFITPAKYVEKNYSNPIIIKMKDFDLFPKVIPTIAWVEKYTANYWIKLIIEQEGSTAFIRCMFNNGGNWYNQKNELIDTSTVRMSAQRNYLIINNLTSSDQNLYRCASPNNKFYTILIVNKNYKKSKYKIKN